MTLRESNSADDYSFCVRYVRERKARLAAESIAEQGLRQLYQSKQLLELVGSIAIAANESSSIEETLRFAITRICVTTGWQVGHVYLVSSDLRLQAVPTSIWYGAEGVKLAEFRAQSETMNFAAGHGLPGRVLAAGLPALIPDVATDGNFPRAAAAVRCGLTSAFAFPVLAGTEVVAVLEFFVNDGAVPDDYFLGLMAQIGAQLGRVVERSRTQERLFHEAFHDPLTGLPNRAMLLDRLSRAMARHQRNPEARFAILFIDLDRFKVVNDSLGHHAGDELLLGAAARLSAVLRETDIIARCHDCKSGERGTLARLGGDEFVVLLEDLRDTVEAARVAIRLQRAIAAPIHIGTSQLSITASIGIASSDTSYESPGDALRDADAAMYRAKACGKAQYQVFDSSMHRQAMHRLDLESSLRCALEQKEFLLHYQPIVNCSTGAIQGFEALLRWSRPGFGIVAPGAFLDVAEETGLVFPLGLWALEEACATARHWHTQFPGHSRLVMSVNLSPNQFAQPQLVTDIRRVLDHSGLDPALLNLEITESATFGDFERANEILTQLRALGVELSIDDFGTGFSSLSYLHRFPLQHLKVDRSFISRMGTDSESLAIVRTIIRLARDLHLQVTAEGVETALQAERLQELGCDYAQGFLYSKPVTREDAESLLRFGRKSSQVPALTH